MKNFINKEIALAETPKVNHIWVEKSEEARKQLLNLQLQQNREYCNLEVVSADKNGSVILRIIETIPAAIRGVMLLNLEETLKKNIDNGLTIWLTPVGDKSKLRQLRGVEIKAEK